MYIYTNTHFFHIHRQDNVFTSQIHKNELEIDEKNLNSHLGLAGGGGLAGLTGGLDGDLTGGLTGGLSGMTIYI
jgi:hypothetical protein